MPQCHQCWSMPRVPSPAHSVIFIARPPLRHLAFRASFQEGRLRAGRDISGAQAALSLLGVLKSRRPHGADHCPLFHSPPQPTPSTNMNWTLMQSAGAQSQKRGLPQCDVGQVLGLRFPIQEKRSWPRIGLELKRPDHAPNSTIALHFPWYLVLSTCLLSE